MDGKKGEGKSKKGGGGGGGPTIIKLKKPAPKQTKPGDWKESEVIGGITRGGTSGTDGTRTPSPIVTELDDKDVASFSSSQPLADEPDYVLCKHCKKPILKTVAAAHIKMCYKLKQEKAKKRKEAKEAAARDKAAKEGGGAMDIDGGGDDGASVNGEGDGSNAGGAGDKVKTAKKAATGAGGAGAAKDAEDGPKKSKKRKADGDAEKAPKPKKKKDDSKPKATKPKGPVDVERQCGVPLPNGQQCARSLTCKSHSMGAKRSVPGRSLPYDMLLNAYQKKNQAKQQKAAIDANAPSRDDLENGGGPVDSDEEKDAVMAAIARSRPQPAEHRTFVPMARKYNYLRMKELMSNAFAGSREGGGLFSTGHGGGGGGGGLLGGTGAGNEGSILSPLSAGLGNSTADGVEGQSRRPSLMHVGSR